MQEHVLRARLDLRRRRRALAQPADVLAERHADASLAALERRPDDLAGEPQPVQPFPLVIVDARGQQLFLPHAHREVLALQELERGENAGRTHEPVVGMEMMPPEEEGGEALGSGHGTRDSTRMHLAALDLLEHRDVDVLRLGTVGEELAATDEPLSGETIERLRCRVLRHAVTPGEPRRSDGAARPDES